MRISAERLAIEAAAACQTKADSRPCFSLTTGCWRPASHSTRC